MMTKRLMMPGIEHKSGINWRIYYADGSVFDSSQGNPEHAPATGIAVIAQVNPLPDDRPCLQMMTDYYIWLGDQWLGCDLFRLWQYLFVDNAKYEFPRAALAGETIASEAFLAIRSTAEQDSDFFKEAII